MKQLINLWLLVSVLSTVVQASTVTSVFTGSRVTHDVFVTGTTVIIPEDKQGTFNLVNYLNGAPVSQLRAASDYPAEVLALPDGDLVGLSYEGNSALLIDGKTLTQKGTLDLGGYTDANGFEPYWMMSGCAMPNGDLYFVSAVDVALVRIPAGATSGTTIATQETAGLSGSSEIACAGGRLYIANHRSLLNPTLAQILVLTTEGKVVETIPAPGLMNILASGNTLVFTTTTTQAAKGSVQFADASGEHLKILASEQDLNLPQKIAFDAVNHRVLVAEKYPPAFVSFDDSTFKLESRVTFSTEDKIVAPRGIAATPDGTGVLIESNGTVSLVK